MATLLFYQKPVPLNADVHRKARLIPFEGDFGFSRETNSVPLAAIEFFDTAREFPVVFTGPEGGAQFPIALVGVRQNENLYVGDGGRWEGKYVPAFVRRYPFVLAEKQEGDDFNVYLDEAYPGFGEKDGERLFTDAGEHTPLLKQALEFLSTYQGEIRRTRQFVERLQALGLLVPRVLEVQRANEPPMVLQGFSMVDEQKLMALPDADLLDLARTGFLAWVYAHLMSLANVTNLASRLDAKFAAAPAAKASETKDESAARPAAKPAAKAEAAPAPKRKQ